MANLFKIRSFLNYPLYWALLLHIHPIQYGFYFIIIIIIIIYAQRKR